MAGERATRPRAPPFIDPPGYARHRPKATLLYRLVERHYSEFFAARQAAGRALPRYGIAVSFQNGSGAKLTVSDVVVESATAISALVTVQELGSTKNADTVWDLRVGNGVLSEAFVVLP